jgi:hypothetical protein
MPSAPPIDRRLPTAQMPQTDVVPITGTMRRLVNEMNCKAAS